FARNKLAMIGFIGLLVLYVIVALAPFLAPTDYMRQNQDYVYGPPSKMTFRGPDGKLGLRLYVHPVTTVLNKETFRWDFVPDTTRFEPVVLFAKGDPYTLFGIIKSNVHLFGTRSGVRIYLLGADSLGRDMLARVLMGGRISMTVGLLGVALTIVFGTIFGTASGYYGGFIDDMMQRLVELIQSFPTVPLWAALSAALPNISEEFTALDRYFLITLI
ncbi:MAG: ABC transporter permease, partial [Chloroflexi bacterium]|nr:ABC transporter permease [Chloroflexota bacterium]